MGCSGKFGPNKDLNYFEAKDAFLTLTDFVRHRISEAGKLERRKAREEENEAFKVHLGESKTIAFLSVLFQG